MSRLASCLKTRVFSPLVTSISPASSTSISSRFTTSLRNSSLTSSSSSFSPLPSLCSVAAIVSRRGYVTSSMSVSDARDEEMVKYREARFVGKEKMVNPAIAAKLISEVPPTEVDAKVVACDGGGGALGHPKVYINLDQPGAHECGYCGLRFIQKAH